MKERILEIVRLMVNKRYLYGAHVVTILDYDINEERERFYLWTDRKTDPYDRPLDSAIAFLKEFHEVKSEVPAQQSAQTQIAGSLMLAQNGLGQQLKEILLDNINRVKDDPAYIEQAEAVKSNVDSLIDLAKVEVEYMKTAMKMQKDDSY